MSDDVIVSVNVVPADIPLTDPFVISRGSMSMAEVAFVHLTLESGVRGFGEIAPFAALTGETRDESSRAARRLAALLVGRRADSWRDIADDLVATSPDDPAARAGLECALVDALARSRNVPLYELWAEYGGVADVRERETDVTLPMLDEARVSALAASWVARGFRILKLKVGDADLDKDINRVESLAVRYPGVSFILDANQGYDRAMATAFVARLLPLRDRIRLIEQPLARDDIEGMALLCASSPVPIAADESVFTPADVQRVIAAKAAHVVNLKIMKSGLAHTLEIAHAAREAGLGLMIGGMMETRLAMGVSFSLVLGFGPIDHLDLDTPLLMAQDPWIGGYAYNGPRMIPSPEAGLGMRPKA
ncbi:MAG TPA: dipeptide epimerase [Candidatus Krumholzibacteria bacterium]|nr:dipeptide epimerase [Candidatus Krumholzibacteria bacterium]